MGRYRHVLSSLTLPNLLSHPRYYLPCGRCRIPPPSHRFFPLTLTCRCPPPPTQDISTDKLNPGARVALRNDSYTLHLVLPTKVDPLVSLMKVEKVSNGCGKGVALRSDGPYHAANVTATAHTACVWVARAHNVKWSTRTEGAVRPWLLKVRLVRLDLKSWWGGGPHAALPRPRVARMH